MICHFTHEPCKYVQCGLWTERRQGCRFVLLVDKLLGTEAPPPRLTAKEWSVLSLITQGYSNKQIAHQLGIEGSTTKNHVSHMLRKLGASSRLEAVVIAAKTGMVQLGTPELRHEN